MRLDPVQPRRTDPKPGERQTRRSRWLASIGRIAFASSCAALGAAALWSLASPEPARGDDPFLRRTATVRAVEQTGPSVVNITTEQVVSRQPFGGYGGNPLFDQFFNDFFERGRRERRAQNLGSGVIIDAERHVLTNAHVVERATRIRVALSDGREFEATLVGADPNNDIAVLQIETDESLPWTEPGSSDDLLPGEPVIAIGNPFGFSNTVTTGVLSAVNRSLRTDDLTYHGFLQTDASINPGNSGGPLLNAEGTLIGINTAIYQKAQGIGFAIPIDVAKRVVRELIRFGAVQPVWLGLEFQNLDPALQEVLDLPVGVSGVLVSDVHKRSPAAEGGVKRGDILTRADGRPLQRAADFFEMLKPMTAGQESILDVWRDGETLTLSVRAEEVADEVIDDLASRMLGMELRELRDGGLAVTQVRSDSAASQIGIEAGDLLLGINGAPLSKRADLRRAVLGLRGSARAMIVVARGNGRYHVTLPLR